MKFHSFIYALILMFAIGCSKSDATESDTDGKDEQKIQASYSVIIEKEGRLNAANLNSEADKLFVADAKSGFESVAKPQLMFEDGNILTFYNVKSDCSGTVTVHNFNSDSSKSIDVFTDSGACAKKAIAMTKAGDMAYIAYSAEQDAETEAYFVRAVDLSAAENAAVDIALDFRPIDLVFARNRVFVLSLDEQMPGENMMEIIDTKTNSILFTENVKLDALGILKNPDGDIIIGYEDLHATYNSQTLDFNFTNYPPDANPKFIGSSSPQFDSSGKMYYARVSGVHSEYERIPAIYDFGLNLSVLYAYENFLTEAQREFEFEIETTSSVQYDEANNLLLIGYKKSGSDDRGGILRIELSEEPRFVGNVDLDGVPISIQIQ